MRRQHTHTQFNLHLPCHGIRARLIHNFFSISRHGRRRRTTPPPPPNTQPSHPKYDITSPFYLGSGDHPDDYITPTRLKQDNYDEWSADIRLALQARRKYGFLKDSISCALPPYTDDDWTTVNAMLVSWILSTIDPEIKGRLTKYREASRLWTHLKTRFSTVNGPRI